MSIKGHHTKQTYLTSWESSLDHNQDPIGKWCRADKTRPTHAFCMWCCKSYSISNNGKSTLIAHSKTELHWKRRNTVCSSSNVLGFVKPVSREEVFEKKVLCAEIQASLSLAEHNIPFTYADHFDELIKAAFDDSSIASSFHSKRTKSSYLLTDGLFPCLHKEVVESLKTNKFSLLIDESNKKYGTTYLNLLVKYFDESLGKITTRFFKSVTVGHAKAKNLTQKILDCINEDFIPQTNLLMVMSDSPNVMRGQRSGVITQLKQLMPHLIDIGGCTLHHVSNAAKYASEEFGETIEEFVQDLFYFFRNHPSVVEDLEYYQKIMEIEEHKILRYVETRWLSLIPVADRILEQLPALKSLFENLFVTNKYLAKQPRFERILKALRDPSTELYLSFLKHGLQVFEKFEKLFQSDQPLIYCLYSELLESLQKLLLRFLKPDVAENLSASAFYKIDPSRVSDRLPDNRLSIGQLAQDCLAKHKDRLSSLDKLDFYKKVRAFYVTAFEKLRHYLPLKSQTLKDLVFLDPMARNLEHTEKAAVRLGKRLNTTLTVDEVDKIPDEIRQYSIEKIPREWIWELNDEGTERRCRVDHYWQKVLAIKDKADTGYKYPVLKKLVFALLSLAHGNADTERSFSDMANILTKHRASMEILTVNALLTTKCEMRVREMACFSEVPKAWHEACVNAKDNYDKRLQRNAAKAKECEKQKEIQKQVQTFNEAMSQQQQSNQKFQKAVKLREKAAEEELAAERQKQKALELIQQGQQLLQKASKSSTKAAKEREKASETIEKVRTKSVQMVIQKAAKKSIKMTLTTATGSDGPESSSFAARTTDIDIPTKSSFNEQPEDLENKRNCQKPSIDKSKASKRTASEPVPGALSKAKKKKDGEKACEGTSTTQTTLAVAASKTRKKNYGEEGCKRTLTAQKPSTGAPSMQKEKKAREKEYEGISTIGT